MTVSLNGFHMRSQSHFDDKEVFDVCVGRLRVLEVLQYCDVSFLLSPPSGYPFATCAFAETRVYDSHTHRYTRKLISSSLLHSVSLISPTDMWEWRVISALVQRLPSFLQGYLEVFDLVLTRAVSPNYCSPLLHVAFWSTLQHVAFRTKGSNISLLRASMLTVIYPQKTAKLSNMNVADF